MGSSSAVANVGLPSAGGCLYGDASSNLSVIDQIFYDCDDERNGFVKASTIVDYIRTFIIDGSLGSDVRHFDIRLIFS